MIFVTVGTHEQSFDRLVGYMDNWAEKHDEKVIIQTGYSTFEPEHCEWKRSYPYQRMLQMISESRIVITHGGPSSFIIPLQSSKIPIVVPRKKKFHEHINDHQVEFSRQFAQRQGNIIVIPHHDIPVLPQPLHRHADRRLADGQPLSDIHRAGVALLLREPEDHLQVVFR